MTEVPRVGGITDALRTVQAAFEQVGEATRRAGTEIGRAMLAGLGGTPVVMSPHLPHGQIVSTGGTMLVGCAPLPDGERLRRAARHEARLIVRARARELGHHCPDPVDRWRGRIPADALMCADDPNGTHWSWPSLDAELFAREVAWRSAESVRHDRDHALTERDPEEPYPRHSDDVLAATRATPPPSDGWTQR